MNEIKYHYGIKNVHYAIVTETVGLDGSITSSYGTPKTLTGAKSISLAPQGDTLNEYADNVIWAVLGANNGYQGDLVLEKLTADFEKDVLGKIEDDNGLMVEGATPKEIYFALLFEFETDKKQRRFCFYKCSAARVTVDSQTKEAGITLSPVTVTVTAMPRPDETEVDTGVTDNLVYSFADNDSASWTNFFSAVPEPTF